MIMVAAWLLPRLKSKNFVTNSSYTKVFLFTRENLSSVFHLVVFRLKFFVCLLVDAAVLAETEKNSALSRIEELEKELQHAKDSNVEFEQLKKDYKELETSGKAHDEELTRLLRPVAQGLSGNDPIAFVLVFNFLTSCLLKDSYICLEQKYLGFPRFCPTNFELTPLWMLRLVSTLTVPKPKTCLEKFPRFFLKFSSNYLQVNRCLRRFLDS